MNDTSQTSNTPRVYGTIDELRTLRTCGICQQVSINPRSLECLHTFCFECLKGKFDETTDNFACPSCNIEMNVPDGFSVDEFLSSLQPNVICSEAGQFFIHEIIGCKKHPDYECNYIYTDSLDFACDVCRHENSENCDVITADVLSKVNRQRNEGLKETVTTTKVELKDMCDKLKSREKTILTNTDSVVLGVMKYFMDLRTQINEYLSKHEKEVLNKLKDLTEKEMSSIVNSMKYCVSLLDNMDTTFSHLLKTENFVGSDVSSIRFFEILQLHAEEYSAKAKSVRQSQVNETEIRFIINTEFEDMLTNGNLIEIESVNQQDYSASASTESQPPQNTTGNDAVSETYPNHLSNTCNRDISITVTPPTESPFVEINDDPPPPYPGFQNLGGILEEQNSFSFGNSPRLPSAPTVTSSVSHSAPEQRSQISDSPFVPVVPRGLTHGFGNEPVSPLGGSRDSHKLNLQPLWKFRLNVPGQLNNPNLVDLSWLNDKMLLVLDKKNSLMSVLSKNGNYCSSYQLHGEPYSCTAYTHIVRPGTFVAITIPKEKKLVFCKLNETFRVEAQPLIMQTNKGYTYIRFHKNNHTFICCSTSPFSLPCVDILDNNGVFLHSFNGSNVTRLGYPRAIQIDDRDTIAISDYKTSLVLLMNNDGRHIGQFNGVETRKLNDPQGIGFSKKLDLFVVADTRGNRLFFIDSRGYPYEYFSESALLGSTPRFVEFSTSSNPTLAVGHGNGYISLYRVSKLGFEQTSL